MDLETRGGNKKGNFVGFVLLEQPVWDKEYFLRQLKLHWQLQREDLPAEQEDDNTLVFQCQGAMVSMALMPAPIPGGEAERQAAKNYRWPGGVEQTKRHKAHLVVGLLNLGLAPAQAGRLMVKILASCCRQSGVLGVYANGAVYQPQFYLDCSQMLNNGGFPLFNLVWFGLYQSEKGCAATPRGWKTWGTTKLKCWTAPPGRSSWLGFWRTYRTMWLPRT